ncbi:MAG: CPBP family intramembrane metalloprotease [Phycisphaerae bacterium]|nr:CPBP family intramembrane metalloprotease [Phycisphaerae bacterium]
MRTHIFMQTIGAADGPTFGGVGLVTLLLAASPLVLIGLWVGDVIRPASFDRGGRRELGKLGWWIWLFAAFVLYSATQFGAAGAAALFGANGGGSRDKAILSLGGYLASLITAAALVRLILPHAAGGGFCTPRLRDLLAAVATLALAAPIVQLASWIAMRVYRSRTGEDPDFLAHDFLRRLTNDRHDPWVWTLIGLAIVAAPIVEELVFRGFVQSAALRLTGRPWPSIFATSALFAAIHYTVAPWYAMPALFTLSVALGIAFERSRSIAVPIGAHALFNAANVVIALMLPA